MSLGFSKKPTTVIPAENVPGLDGKVFFRPWSLGEYEKVSEERATIFESADRREVDAVRYIKEKLSGIILSEDGTAAPPATVLSILDTLEAPTILWLWEYAAKHCGMSKPEIEIEKN
jgi:hypothetical protein